MTTKQDFLKWMPGWAVTQSEAKWLVAYKMAAREGQTPGEAICFLKQAPRIWHAFYRERATGSATTPNAALNGSLGDVIDDDKSIRAYCKLVLDAPSGMVAQFAGLQEAQSQAYNELNQ